MLQQDEFFMKRAYELAKIAATNGEVPVGAVITVNQEIISEAYNQPITLNDPTAHAEILCIREAAKRIGNYRLLNTTLYVTLEPCLMCASAMVHARIHRLVYGAFDLKTGAIESQIRILDQPFLNHKISYLGGVMKECCGELLSQFFRERR